MAASNPLLAEIKAFLKRPEVKDARITPTGFGIAVMNDGKFVPDLLSGKRKRVWPETADKVRAHIRSEMNRLGLSPPESKAA